MLTRLVRMRFQPDQVALFLSLYATMRAQIIGQPGCLGLQLVREILDPAAFATWSTWESAAALESYRASPFFRQYWPQVRVLFRQPAEAVSFEVVSVDADVPLL